MNDGGITGRRLNRIDWVGIVVCLLIGLSVTKAVGRQIEPAMGFWSAFVIEVAAGGAVGVALLAVWLGLIWRKT